MLLAIRIRNVAVIEEAEAEFAEGLNILSGETGAGKSIIIDSVRLILGERADKDMIRTGHDKAVVEAVFDISKISSVKDSLRSVFGEDADDLIISRELSMEGRNVCRVNGHMATLAQLKELTTNILDLHGQHQHQSLLDPDNNIRLLDSYCDNGIIALKSEYAQLRTEYYRLKKQISALQMNEQERTRRLDLLRYQFNEISAAKLMPGEEEDLIRQREILNNYEKLSTALQNAYNSLAGADGDTLGGYQQLENACYSMQEIASYDQKYSSISERLNLLIIEAEDITSQIRTFVDEFSFDVKDIDEIESRLDQISRLKRKYGATVEDILRYYDETALEIEKLENSTFEIESLENQKTKAFNGLVLLGKSISEIRSNAAFVLEKEVEKQLADLGMDKARFHIKVDSEQQEGYNFYPDGIDRVEFLIAANVGEELKHLSSVISGGELSRIMLALKNISADIDHIPTLIFDEIDTGISGNMARAVGEKLVTISSNRQVICVTHSAQIAAMADNHLFIEKTSDDKSTRTSIVHLDEQLRYKEISRLVGGEVSALSDDHAKEIINWSNNYKKKIRS